MEDREYLNIALAKMHTGEWFGWRKEDDNGNKIPNSERMQYQHIKIVKEGATMPSEADVNAKIQEIKDADTQKETDKTNGTNKLKALGLTDAEIKALIGG